MNGAAAFSYTIPWRRRRGPGPHRRFPRSSRRDLPPVESGIAKWFDRHTSQEVCPWNAKFSRAATEPTFMPRPELVTPDLAAFATMDDAEFKSRLGDTPLSRAKRAGLARNAVALRGNDGGRASAPATPQ